MSSTSPQPPVNVSGSLFTKYFQKYFLRKILHTFFFGKKRIFHGLGPFAKMLCGQSNLKMLMEGNPCCADIGGTQTKSDGFFNWKVSSTRANFARESSGWGAISISFKIWLLSSLWFPPKTCLGFLLLYIWLTIYVIFLLKISKFNVLGGGPVLRWSCIEVSEMWKIFASMLIFRIIKLSQRDLEVDLMEKSIFQFWANISWQAWQKKVDNRFLAKRPVLTLPKVNEAAQPDLLYWIGLCRKLI